MFERYTEKARRCIFFARYEASQFGSRFIEPEHLLLGLLREDRKLITLLRISSPEALRQKIEERLGPVQEKIATSVDLPLSAPCKRALSYATEDAEKLGHKNIDTHHLMLGLLREKNGASELIAENKINHHAFFEIVRTMPESPPARDLTWAQPAEPEEEPEPEAAMVNPAAAALAQPLARLAVLIRGSRPYLTGFSNADGAVRLKRKNWTRCHAIGHLIDWTSAHHLWIARALTEPKVTSAGYPLDEWVTAQQYDQLPFPRLVKLWLAQSELLLHVIAQIPENKLATPIRVGIDEPAPLLQMVERYVQYCEDLVAQILVKA